MNLTVFDKPKGLKIKMTSVDKPYVCQYCGSAYVKESTLAVHMCEQKRRHLAKSEKHVQLGYQTYVRFFQLSQKIKNIKTYEEFAKSQYYNAFVKFGSFLSNVNPLYLDRYIDYVVTSGVKLDHWCREEMYYAYVLDLIKKEPAEVALQRTISTMMAWADTNTSQWNHYFKYVSLNRAVYDIKDGKISPWLVLNCDTGRAMLGKLNDEQLGIIFNVMDPTHWARRFKTYPADMELVKSVVIEGNL
jgi:ribosomal protein L37AE/L43A